MSRLTIASRLAKEQAAWQPVTSNIPCSSSSASPLPLSLLLNSRGSNPSATCRDRSNRARSRGSGELPLFERVSYSLGWTQIHYVAKATFEFRILLHRECRMYVVTPSLACPLPPCQSWLREGHFPRWYTAVIPTR